MCVHCETGEIETETHFLLHCHKYISIRNLYFNKFTHRETEIERDTLTQRDNTPLSLSQPHSHRETHTHSGEELQTVLSKDSHTLFAGHIFLHTHVKGSKRSHCMRLRSRSGAAAAIVFCTESISAVLHALFKLKLFKCVCTCLSNI